MNQPQDKRISGTRWQNHDIQAVSKLCGNANTQAAIRASVLLCEINVHIRVKAPAPQEWSRGQGSKVSRMYAVRTSLLHH